MEVEKAAETNGSTTSSFLLHKVSGFFYLPKLRDAAESLAEGLWGGAFGIQEEEEADVVEDDLEAGAPEAEEDEEAVVEDDLEARAPKAEEETNVRNSIIVEKALVIMPTFPASLCFTLPGLYSLAQIKWQLPPSGFPSPTLHKWYIVCVTSLLTEFVASIAQWIISSAAGNPTSSVYYIIVALGRIACYFLFLVSLAVLLYS